MTSSNYDYLFRILLVGDSNVGKTCILSKFTDNAFNYTFISTIGVDFKIKTIEVNGKKIKLNIWDSPGQERLRPIISTYYRSAMGIMVIYDVGNKNSFDNIPNWLKEIDKYGNRDVIKMLIGNKYDSEDQRVISEQEGEKLANDNQILFLETSAKLTMHIKMAFYQLARAILNQMPKKENCRLADEESIQSFWLKRENQLRTNVLDK